MRLAVRALVVPRPPGDRNFTPGDLSRTASWTLSASVFTVAAVSAFEVPLPRLAAGGLQLSSLEATVLVALAAAALVLVREGRLRWQSPLTWPGVALLGAAIAAALQAPAHEGNALRFCGRLVAAGLVAALAMHALPSRRAARTLVAVMLTVGAIVGAIALLEVASVPWVLSGLKAFRPGFHVVGGQMRATSTLLYPTVTSMYLECVFAMGLWWLVEPPAARRPLVVRLAPAAALLLVGAGIIATFTRTGLIVTAVSLAGVAALRFARHQRFDQGQRALASVAVVMIAFVAVSRTPEVWVSRVSADSAEDWYGARFEVPPRLSVRPSGVFEVPITVTNDGRLTWQSDREPIFALSYHWLTADTGEIVEFEGARTLFGRPVGPGKQVTMAVTVRAPRRSGDYQLAWDVVHEGRAWLSTMGVPGVRSQVRVEGPADADTPLPTHGQLPVATTRLPRRTLWQAALRIARAHPFSGIGPDNFRLVYGEYLGLATWDRRVHANNMYLEVLAGIGVFGLAALVWLVGAAGRHLWTRWRSASAGGATGWACMLAAWFGVAGHGLVDSFLTFTPTYVIFALMAGLAVAPALDAPAGYHANRV
jgi:hypothetical protein